MSNPLTSMRRVVTALWCATVLPLAPLSAQSHDPPGHGAHAPGDQAKRGAGESHDLSRARQTFEVMASEVFRTSTAIVPVGHRLTAEIHYFGLPDRHTRENLAHTALSWQVPLGRHGFIAPGVGYYSGVDHAAPAGSVRWLYERGRFITEGLLVQAHDQSDETERGQIWDGNHVSWMFLRKRLELGPTWEHIHVREDDEWKWGGRVAVRVHPRMLGQLYVLTPGATEWRAGFVVR